MKTVRRSTVALIALATVTRLAAAVLLGDQFHFVDELLYVDAARELLAGRGFGAGYANVPAQPVLLALLAAPWPDDLLFLRCAHALVTGVLGGAVVYALGTRLLGVGAARGATLLYALDPLLVLAGGLLYPEAFAAVALAGAFLAASLAVERDRLAAAVSTGVLLGLTVQFRPVAVLLVPLVALWTGAGVAAAPLRRLRHMVLVTVAAGLTMAPWLLHNLARDGHVVPTAMPGLQGVPILRDEIEDRGLMASIAVDAWRRPMGTLRRVAREFAYFWELYPTRLQIDNPAIRARMHRQDARVPIEPDFAPNVRNAVSAVSFGSELTLALAGLVLGWRSRRPAVLLLAATAIIYGFGYALLVAKLRYRIAVLPCVFLLAGFGAARVIELIGRRAPSVPQR